MPSPPLFTIVKAGVEIGARMTGAMNRSPLVVWCLAQEQAHWQAFCLARGVSGDEFVARWRLARTIYDLAAAAPREPMEALLSRFLLESEASGYDELDRRCMFGRVWGRILQRMKGHLGPFELS
ncbi:hypothetical protein SAMN05428989_1690 [Pseudoxanthomonas sp. GM95]|uniref:hypothetical protein n=1 Tax=Pseudoxanthomonas sp. GM95 TaxID=1881043 RepID=UPI0008C0679D|nr:hypothetical protein [Pseudoxanthomonas sp. GM95]SEL45701.1 hypothetical protein SAMN05428989_1690 [Pseudoxanthomonas sp. GM95]